MNRDDIIRMAREAGWTSYDSQDERFERFAALVAAAELRRLARVEAQRDALLEQRDELRRALEIIAVGDATNPQAQAAEELIALGYWRDVPEARAAIKAVEESKTFLGEE